MPETTKPAMSAGLTESASSARIVVRQAGEDLGALQFREAAADIVHTCASGGQRDHVVHADADSVDDGVARTDAGATCQVLIGERGHGLGLLDGDARKRPNPLL